LQAYQAYHHLDNNIYPKSGLLKKVM